MAHRSNNCELLEPFENLFLLGQLIFMTSEVVLPQRALGLLLALSTFLKKFGRLLISYWLSL